MKYRKNDDPIKTGALAGRFLRRVLAMCAAFCLILQMSADSAHAAAKKITKYGMSPISGDLIADGEYEVEAASNSSFFKVRNARLAVEDGKMEMTFEIPSLSYRYIYEGTKEEAEAAPENEWQERVESEEYTSLFTVDVPALNAEFPCAAWSIAKERWYDRNLLIDASSLPEGALLVALPDYDLIEEAVDYYIEQGLAEMPEEGEEAKAAEEYPAESAEPCAIDLADGEYSIEVNMTGGSGRAQVSSPTLLLVRNGHAYAQLLWSSAYYDYMIVGGERCYNLTQDGGNSRFEIPIPIFDEAIPVIGDTTAMGDPLEIEYTLTFYEDSVGNKGAIPQEAAKKVLWIALAVIVIGGILNYLLKRKKA